MGDMQYDLRLATWFWTSRNTCGASWTPDVSVRGGYGDGEQPPCPGRPGRVCGVI